MIQQVRVNTFRELREELNRLTDEQLDCDLVVNDASDEYHGVYYFVRINQDDDVLDKGHPILVDYRYTYESLDIYEDK